MNYYGQKIMTGSVVMTGSQPVDQSHTRGTISEFMGHHRVLFFSNFHLEVFTNIKSERHSGRISIILEHSGSSDRLSDRQKNRLRTQNRLRVQSLRTQA